MKKQKPSPSFTIMDRTPSLLTDMEITDYHEIPPRFKIGDTVLVKGKHVAWQKSFAQTTEVWVGKIVEVRNRRYHIEYIEPHTKTRLVILPVRFQMDMEIVEDVKEALKSIEILYGNSVREKS